MEKSEILRSFLKKGVQLNEETLDFLYTNPSILSNVEQLPTEKLPLIITKEFLKKFTNGESIHPLKLPTTQSKVSIEDIASHYTNQYNVIKQVLVNKGLSNLISISKISAKLHNFSLIGMITEVKDTIVTLEDNTGIYSFKIDSGLSKYLVGNEVIGIVCENTPNSPQIIKVVHPDVELNKEITKTTDEIKILLTPDPLNLIKDQSSYKKFLKIVKEQKKVIVIGFNRSEHRKYFGKLSDEISPHKIILLEEDSIESSENIMTFRYPTLLDISGVKVFLSGGKFLNYYRDKWNMDSGRALINLIKKRNLNPSHNILDNNTYLLDIIPDIMILISDENRSLNYKGITIIITDPTTHMLWSIDLKTRETFKIDLS